MDKDYVAQNRHIILIPLCDLKQYETRRRRRVALLQRRRCKPPHRLPGTVSLLRGKRAKTLLVMDKGFFVLAEGQGT
jgi:hypothetical protein